MRICLICTEYFGWGASGGFGFATRILGRELVKRGLDVSAVIPQPRGMTETELLLDGVRIHGVPRLAFLELARAYKACDADVYQSIEPSLGSYVAMKAMPHRKHAISLQDPRTLHDWLIEFRHPTLTKRKLVLAFFYYENYFTRWAIKNADAIYAPAKFLISKSRKKYGLMTDPVFMPTPTFIPDTVQKSAEPTVCFVGRWDRRKRPELFFELAKQFPNVKFIAVGKAQDKVYDDELRQRYSSLPNVEMTGFINQFEGDALSKVYERSWILVNTSAREGLPNTYFEACAHRCAILSAADPDRFTTRFGELVINDDFAAALKKLLINDRWKTQGQHGYEYAKRTYDIDSATALQLQDYQRLLSSSPSSSAS